MNLMMRCILIILSGILLLGAASSCSEDVKYEFLADDTDEDSDERVTLKFMNSWGGLDAETLQDILNSFKADNPDIEVINEAVYGDDFLSRLVKDFASGFDPDVFGVKPGSVIEALIDAGKVADLTDVLEKDINWKRSFRRTLIDYNDKIYGLPFEITIQGLFVNTDMFANHNVKIPETYQELKYAVMAFKADKLTIIPIAYDFTPEGSYIYQNIAAMLGGGKEIKDPFSVETKSNCYVKAMDYMKELYRMGAFPPDVLTMDSGQRDLLFLEKKAAMIVQESSFIGRCKDIEDTVDIVPFPYIPEPEGKTLPNYQDGKKTNGALVYGLGGGTFYMSSAAWDDEAKRVASIKLLKALTSRESEKLFMDRETGLMSGLYNEDPVIFNSKLCRRLGGLLYAHTELIAPPDHCIDRGIWEDIIVGQFPYMLEGSMTPAGLWEQARAKDSQIHKKQP